MKFKSMGNGIIHEGDSRKDLKFTTQLHLHGRLYDLEVWNNGLYRIKEVKYGKDLYGESN